MAANNNPMNDASDVSDSGRLVRKDKGVKRPQYNNSRRVSNAQAKILKQRLQDIAHFEQLELDFEQQRAANGGKLPAKRKKVDKRKHRKRDNRDLTETRHEKREALLQEFCKERVCPRCKQFKINSRQWVFVKGTVPEIICRGCYQKIKKLIAPIAIELLFLAVQQRGLRVAELDSKNIKDLARNERERMGTGNGNPRDDSRGEQSRID